MFILTKKIPFDNPVVVTLTGCLIYVFHVNYRITKKTVSLDGLRICITKGQMQFITSLKEHVSLHNLIKEVTTEVVTSCSELLPVADVPDKV